MGSTVANGLQESVLMGIASLQMAVHVHLRSNFYPPIPERMIPIAVKAIERYKKGNQTRITLPKGVLYKGERFISPSACIKEFKLGAFLGDE